MRLFCEPEPVSTMTKDQPAYFALLFDLHILWDLLYGNAEEHQSSCLVGFQLPWAWQVPAHNAPSHYSKSGPWTQRTCCLRKKSLQISCTGSLIKSTSAQQIRIRNHFLVALIDTNRIRGPNTQHFSKFGSIATVSSLPASKTRDSKLGTLSSTSRAVAPSADIVAKSGLRLI